MSDMLGAYKINTIAIGDAVELVSKIPDNSVDLILTDPPWGINYKYDHEYDDNSKGYNELCNWIVYESNRILKPGMFAFVYQATKQLRDTWQYFPENSRIFASCKNFVQIKPIPVQFAVDYIIFWQKPGKFQLKGLGRDYNIAKTNRNKDRSRILKKRTLPLLPSRPLDAVINIVANMCPDDGIVVDFFMGSGTVAAACKTTSRKWWGCEIDKETADFAQERINNTQLGLPLIFDDVENELEQLRLNYA